MISKKWASNFVGIALSLLSMTVVHAQIFVTSRGSDTVGEYTISGATINASLVSGLSGPYGVAVSGSNLYVVNDDYASGAAWIDEYTLGVTPGTITSSNTSFISGLSRVAGIAISGSYIFVVNYGNNTIGEYTTSGATINASLITNLNGPLNIAISGSNLFVLNSGAGGAGSIGEYTLGAAPGTISSSNPSLISGLTDPTGITISGSNLFVTNSGSNGGGSIGEYTTSGATINTMLVSGLNGPLVLGVSGSNLLVTLLGTSTVGQYTLGATPGTVTSSNPSFFSTGDTAYGITIATPEPSTWAMLLSGLSILAFWRLRFLKVRFNEKPSKMPVPMMEVR